ncbi:DinB family protein [Cellulomonas sp. NPDC055163]
MTTPLEPDTKDWTWVLDRACPECGFLASDVDPAGIPAALRASVPRWSEALARPDARERPDASTWSVLEYGAHTRDVHRIFGERLRLILEEDDPQFPNWDQDATAVEDRYDLQDPAVVAVELAQAAEEAAVRFGGVPDDAWERPGRRSNGSVFTTRTLGAYYLHDVLHHLHDVRA